MQYGWALEFPKLFKVRLGLGIHSSIYICIFYICVKLLSSILCLCEKKIAILTLPHGPHIYIYIYIFLEALGLKLHFFARHCVSLYLNIYLYIFFNKLSLPSFALQRSHKSSNTVEEENDLILFLNISES